MIKELNDIIEEDRKVNGSNKRTISYLRYYRKAQWYKNKSKYRYLLNKIVLTLRFRYTGIELKETVAVGKGLRLPHLQGIIVSDYAVIGDDCTIYHQVTIGANEHKLNYQSAPHIGNRVYIGAGAKLIGNICIGNDVIIGANAVVTKDVPDGMTVVGINKHIVTYSERIP